MFAQENSANQLKKEYAKALDNFELAPAVYDLYCQVANPSAQTLAYKGALEAIMTKTTWNIFKKINYLNKSEESLQHAVEMAPENIEVRFIRLAVQHEIPSYLGYSNNIKEDIQFITSHFNQLQTADFSPWNIKQAMGFVHHSGRFTTEQIKRFQELLAANL
jgi:hypothetical protein